MAHIFIIEDDEDHRLLMKVRLEVLGHRVSEARDGPTGLKLISEQIPDLVVLDVMMPHVDGIQLCKAIKSNKNTQGIPIIILTASEDVSVRKSCMEAGADKFIKKPWSIEELAETVSQLLKPSK